ncbi:MAG: phosphatase PAP2 family protein [Firmicutes bacterium]|nr:phosphatase PAP2 family protein [Alicyclobacillaceae bacterium]MCL6498231.1 phosphatase PAP2 family protein [Bacillota bacterium]
MTRGRAFKAGVWAVALAVAAWLAPSSPVHALDLWMAARWTAVGRTVPALNLVWIVGAVPVAFTLAVGLGYFRRGLWALGALVVGSAVEVALKHGVTTPFPQTVAPPPPWPIWIRALNPSPNALVHRLAPWIGAAGTVAHPRILHGSFPSGHVFRLDLLAAAVWPRWAKSPYLEGWTVLTGLAVVATGGHWAWDVVGAYCLVRLLLTLRPTPPASG